MSTTQRRLLSAFFALLLPCSAVAGPAIGQTEGGDLRAGPAGGAWLLDVDPDVAHGETARQLSLDMIVGAKALLRTFDFGQPVLEERLQRQTDQLREALLAAPPEDLQVLADRMGPDLASLHRAFAMQVGAHMAFAAEKARERGLAAPKSAGFPSLPADLPAYPNVTAVSTFVEVVLAPFSADAIQDAIDDLGRVFQELDVPFCRVEPDADGRAERRPNEVVYVETVLNQVANILYGLQQDGCGGASVDVTVVSLGASCSICCIPFTLANGIANLLYETATLCDSMVDSAEVEAAWHAGKTAVEGLEHVHGDVENVQGTADEILELVTCKPVASLLRQHGCDGKDSDCDGLIDECDEDAFGPDLHVDEAVAGPWYRSMTEAREAVLRAVSASDDCQAVSVDLAPLTGACGSVEALVTATDACGNSTVRRAVVRVDASSPVVALPAALSGSCHADVDAAEAAVLAAAAISDDCSGPGELAVAVESTVSECSLRVKITATDRAGRVASDAVTVSLDHRTPSVEIGRLELATLGPACFASIAEAEAAVASFVRASDNCTDGADLVPVISSSGDPCELRVTATVTDDCGRSASDEVELRVDGGAPVVTASVETDTLRPANHSLIDVGLDFGATDDCDGEIVTNVRVTSDEPTQTASGAGGDQGPDAILLRTLDGTVERVLLRAERSSSGNGRVYRIHVEATDPCGQSSTATVDVSVPPNGNAPAVDDGQYYDATGTN